LVRRSRLITPLAVLFVAPESAITNVHHYVSDEATLRKVGRIDPSHA